MYNGKTTSDMEDLPKRWKSKLVKSLTGNDYLVTIGTNDEGVLVGKIERIKYLTDRDRENGR